MAASDVDTSIRSRDLAAREHEARAGEEWLTVKAELARRNIPADAWCRNQLGVTMRSMEHRAYLFKNWTVYKAAWQQAPQDGLHGLVYALALIRRELGRSVRREKPASDRTMPVTDRADDELLSLGLQFYEGDALAVLGTLPDKAANCAVTSPPFFGGLRDYGNLARLGREPGIEDYLDRAVAMFRELRRVLTDDGSLWVHMGDSYAAATSTWATNNGIHTRQAAPMMRGTRATLPPGHKPKDLMMIAARLALALQQDGWYLRNEIIWRKRRSTGKRP